MNFKKWVKNIQTAGYNGARTVLRKHIFMIFGPSPLRNLESRIDVGQRINVGPGKVGKKNERRALNKCRGWKICQKE